MNMRWIARLAAAASLVAAPSGAKPSQRNKAGNEEGRAACSQALARGQLDALRVAWTWWPDRSTSQTVEVKRGRLARFGGRLKGERSERALTPEERKALLDALRAARVDKLTIVDRDVKSDQDRVLNIDVLAAGGEPIPVGGAFVRTGSLWHSGATAALADLLEKWLAPAPMH
jgi:hypothetical protein